jgi:hypothetical protein
MDNTFTTYEGHKRELLKRFDFTSIHQARKILVDFDNDKDIYEYLLYLNNSIENNIEQQENRKQRKKKLFKKNMIIFQKTLTLKQSIKHHEK